MPSPPFSHITFMIALVLLCIISIALLALQQNSLSDISANYQRIAFPLYPYDRTEPNSLQREINGLPLNLARAPLKLALAASIVALVASIAVLAGFLLTQVDGKRRFLPFNAYRIHPAYFILPLLSLSVILALACLVTTFATHAHSSTFNFAYWLLRGDFIAAYDIGQFDLEAWVCQMALQNITQEDRDMFMKTCKNSEAGRWILVPFFALAIFSLALGWWTCRGLEDRAVQKNRADDWEGGEHEIL